MGVSICLNLGSSPPIHPSTVFLICPLAKKLWSAPQPVDRYVFIPLSCPLPICEYLCRAQCRQQCIGLMLLELYDDHSFDLAVSDRVPDFGRCDAERTVGHTHQPRVAVHQYAPVSVLEPAESVDVEDVLRHEAMEETERRQSDVAVRGQIQAELGA